MNKYLMVYRGAVQPQDGNKHMTEWMAWVESMGDAMVDPGIPVGASKTVTSNKTTDTHTNNPIAGISIIQAKNLKTAIALTQQCPHLSIGGSIELAEAMTMPMA